MDLPFLLYDDGDGAQRTLVLTGERLSVGRAEGSDLRLAWDPQISRLHAILERFGGSWTILDEGLSRNGTLVNGTTGAGPPAARRPRRDPLRVDPGALPRSRGAVRRDAPRLGRRRRRRPHRRAEARPGGAVPAVARGRGPWPVPRPRTPRWRRR